MSNAIRDYLQIPAGYFRGALCSSLSRFAAGDTVVECYASEPPPRPRGLRWSAAADAIELEDGTTFALSHEVALFLEGFVAQGRLIHFAYILHLLRLLGYGPALPSLPTVDTLRRAFKVAQRPLRNAGAFCALLCRHVPAVADPVDIESVGRLWISNSSLMSLLCAAVESKSFHIPEEPPLRCNEFEGLVVQALETFTADEVDHWLKHGRGPVVEAGEPLAEEILAAKPRPLAGVLAELAQRGRLTGAVPFVDQMVGVLSLPPRRLTPNELPIDGYTDVTTRGQPEHLLPSQFALDDLEFVRRFAANELLFFRREEPHAPLREELVLLLDQGVRTWGDVRLVLSSAVFALGRRCARRNTPLQLATTSNRGELLDFRQPDTAALGDLLESSDLTPNPALALERVLETPAEDARDVVLLTHPRNLHEPDVQDAARRAAGSTRLFAVTVDEAGRAELVEMRHGTAVSLSRFRIDWTQALPPPVVPAVVPQGTWQGNVEPVGFPFRFGISGNVKLFAFDTGGQWMLIASRHGMLHLERLDGTHPEVLPRGWLNDALLSDVEAVLGVPGGFVVGGKVDMELVAFHYDIASRTCTARILGVPTQGPRQWYYVTKHHSVAVKTGSIVYGVDLGTGQRGSHTPGGTPSGTERVVKACAEADKYRLPPPWALVGMGGAPITFCPPTLVVNLHSGMGRLVIGTDAECATARTPKADGKPALKDCRLVSAQNYGNTLALVTSPLNAGEPQTLRLLRIHDGVPLTEFPHSPNRGYLLSWTGGQVARQTGLSQVTVHDETGGPPCWVSPKGRCHHDVGVQLGHRWLCVTAAGHNHLLRWDRGALVHLCGTGDAKTFLDRVLTGASGSSEAEPPGMIQARISKLLHDSLRANPYPAVRTLDPSWSRAWYDPRRFRQAVPGPFLIVVVDVYGQIMVWNRAMELLCMFFVFRDKFAAWMPDGTRYGPPSLTGGPATAGALEKIGQVLRAASEPGRGQL